MTLRRLCPVLLVVGVVLMIPFQATITLTLGVICLTGFVVTGLFVVATPEFLARGEEPDARSTGRERRG